MRITCKCRREIELEVSGNLLCPCGERYTVAGKAAFRNEGRELYGAPEYTYILSKQWDLSTKTYNSVEG